MREVQIIYLQLQYLLLNLLIRRISNFFAQQGLFAFYFELCRGYKVVSKTFHEIEKCGLQEIQHFSYDVYYPIPKNSSFKEIVKIG